MLPFTYRGYRYNATELEDFREFKRAGVIPRQARPESYAIDYRWVDNGWRTATRLWKRTRVTPGCPPNVWEQEIAGLVALNTPASAYCPA